MTDPLVQSALDHWGPRFLLGGVDPSDLTRIASSLDGWDSWCQAWCDAAGVHERLGREALAAGRTRSAGAHLAQAAVTYHFAKFLFVHAPDELGRAHARAVACLTDALPHLDPPGERLQVPYDGRELVGVLRRPPGRGPHPVVVLIAGLDSAKEEFRPVEQLFLERGLATCAVDGPGQGEGEATLRIRPDWEVPGAAILDRLGRLAGIDPARIGVWGVSLGGYYAARLAAGDARVRAAIALSGPYDFGEPWDQLPELTRSAFRVRAGCASDTEARQRAHACTLAGRAGRIRCPLLIVAGRLDRIVPFAQAERLAREAGGPTQLLALDQGNHVCTNVAPQHRYRAADWMAQQLRG